MYGHKIQLFKFTQCSRPVCHTEYGDDKLTYLLKDIWVFFKSNKQHTKLVYITVVVFYERQRNVHSITKRMQTYIVTTDISWNLVYLAIQYIVQEKNKCRYIISIDQ